MRDESEVVQENLSAEICANSVNMRNFVCDTTGTHYFNGALTSYLWTVFNEKIQERNPRHVMTLQHTTNKLTEKEVQEKISSLGEIIRMYDTYYIFGDLSIIRLDAVHKSNRTDIYAEIITEFLTDIEKNMDAIYEIFPSVNFTYCKIRWYLIRSDGSVMDVDFSEKLDDIILDEAYPYISYENSLDNYIYDYLNSDESILLLMGDVGTGKTTLIRYILKLMSMRNKNDLDVYYSTSYQVLYSDELFMNIIENNKEKVLVLEDIDIHLRSREEDNPLMYKLLGSSDGLVRNNCKIIISTNAESEKQIDDALIRPGRCYDVIKSRKLNLNESNKVLEKLGNSKFLDHSYGTEFSLSNIYKFHKTGNIVEHEKEKKLGRSAGFKRE